MLEIRLETNLVENWFRLPSAMDNRPLKFEEFETKTWSSYSCFSYSRFFEIEKSSNNPESAFDASDSKWQDSENK